MDVDGMTLREILREERAARRRTRRAGSPRGPRALGTTATGAGWSIATSNRLNVMISRDGSVKVMDFGIARAVADSQATMTQTSSVAGTAQYIRPSRPRAQTVDSRSDLYSTGCLLFELLMGRTPFVQSRSH